MYIRKSTAAIKGKTYTNYMLVESVATPKGPRQKTVCSLGNLKPRPSSEWLKLVHKIEDALSGQGDLFEKKPRGLVKEVVEKIARSRAKDDCPECTTSTAEQEGDGPVSVFPEKVEVEDARESGPEHVGNTMYDRVGMEKVLAEAGLSAKARLLSRAMVLNRLVQPCSEHAMPHWFDRTALSDLVGEELDGLDDERLYRNMDKLHPCRFEIEKSLRRREEDLFGLDRTIYLYDLTSHYFEGQALGNAQAKLGYSRDNRPDCKQVVVGLAYDRDGFPVAHEVFDGNRQDRTTLAEMLSAIEDRAGRPEGKATVVVDRGMACEENLSSIRAAGYHYVVASRQSERNQWLDEFEAIEGFREIIRQPSPRNPFQKKSKVEIRKMERGEEVFLLCISEGRKLKDRAIRQRFENSLLRDLEKLSQRVAEDKLKKESAVHEAIGRLKERYPRVARYYRMEYDPQARKIHYCVREDKREIAERLDGSYLLKTTRKDLSDEDIWRTYMLLTRAENAFRNMKSPLAERPIFHQIERRTQTHIFLCILAYHLLVAIEKMFLDAGIHTSWDTIRKTLSTHQIVTVSLPTDNGKILKIRKATKPEKEHLEIYNVLKMKPEMIKPRKWWA